MSRNLIADKNFEVLIVEDEPILAMAMEAKLKKMGLSVSGVATCADNAILNAQNTYPDLAIIDINLNSSKTGIDVANYIWKNFNIPIIFLTSYYNDKILNKAMESEPYAYLLKPCRDAELKVAINTVMNKHQYFFKEKKNLNKIDSKYIYLEENVKFDLIKNELFVNDSLIKLTKNEKKLFSILCQNPKSIVGFNSIFSYIWREDVYDLAKLRSLIYRLKTKLGFNPFENIYEEGYRIKTIEISS